MFNQFEQIAGGFRSVERLAGYGTRSVAATLRQLDAVLASGSVENARSEVIAAERRRAVLAALGFDDQMSRTA